MILYFFSVANFDSSFRSNIHDCINRIVTADYSSITAEDATAYIKNTLTAAKENIPQAAAAMAHMAVSGDDFGQPIDQNPTQPITPVFSVQGGTVIEIGATEELGSYIVISHARGAQSVYGNCSRVYVQKLERVKKGQIIGEYDTGSDAEFCYSLVTDQD